MKSKMKSQSSKGFIKVVLAYCLLSTANLLSPANCFSQTYPDAGSWNTFNLEYGLNTRLSALFTQECRIKENFSRLNLFYTNVGLEYKVLRNFKTAFVYRFVNKYQDDNTFSFRHRLMLDLTYKTKLGKLGLSYRHRLQAEERDMYSSAGGLIPEWYSRSKIAAKYDLDKPWAPYISAEFRYQLRDFRNVESDNTWHRSRYCAGVDYKKSERSTFGVYYLIQFEYNIPLPEDQYIVGLEYTLTL